MKQDKRPSYWTVLIGGGVTGAVVSALLVSAGFMFIAYVYHHRGAQSQNGAFSKLPIPVSAPLVRHQNKTPTPATAQDSSKGSSTGYVPMRPVSFAPLVHRVIPSVVNISTDDPEPASTSTDKDADKSADKNKEKDSKDAKHGVTTVGRVPSNPSMSYLCPQSGGKGAKLCTKDPKTGKLVPDTSKKDPKAAGKSSSNDSSSEEEDDSSSMGSGFIIDPRGIIVTNAHVVNSTGIIHVSLSDGRVLTATLLGTDPLTDIAVLKVNSAEDLPYVNWGRSRSMQIGDWVVAAGNPFGFGSSITAGIVSAVGRDLGLGDLDDFMQFDAPINPGNSGGPTFNMKGEVVAMNAAIATPNEGSVGIGFGIPSDLVAPIVKQIEDTGIAMHGWLGVHLKDDDLPVEIVKVDPDSVAWNAGLRPGDKILQIDGKTVPSARAILRSVGLSAPGTVFAFTISQGGIQHTIPIKLSARPDTAVKDGDSPQATDGDDSNASSETADSTAASDNQDESET